MNGLTRKQVYVDKNLSAVLQVAEGELVSYADIQKRLHKYIKENDLRNPQHRPQPTSPVTPTMQVPGVARMKECRNCGEQIPSEAVFCDLCGVRQ